MTKLVTVTAPNGARIQVAEHLAPRFQGFINDISAAGVEIRKGESGGYADRNIRGSNKRSMHADGAAVDINWGQNELGRRDGGALAAQLGEDKVREFATAHGLKWGHDFKGRKDPMHFEALHNWEAPAGYGTTAVATTGTNEVPAAGMKPLALLANTPETLAALRNAPSTAVAATAGAPTGATAASSPPTQLTAADIGPSALAQALRGIGGSSAVVVRLPCNRCRQ